MSFFDEVKEVKLGNKVIKKIEGPNGEILYNKQTKATPNITLESDTDTYDYSDAVTLYGTLSYNNIGISNVPIKIYQDNKLIKTVATTNDGGFLITFLGENIDFNGSNYVAVFDGNELYSNISSSNIKLYNEISFNNKTAESDIYTCYTSSELTGDTDCFRHESPYEEASRFYENYTEIVFESYGSYVNLFFNKPKELWELCCSLAVYNVRDYEPQSGSYDSSIAVPLIGDCYEPLFYFTNKEDGNGYEWVHDESRFTVLEDTYQQESSYCYDGFWGICVEKLDKDIIKISSPYADGHKIIQGHLPYYISIGSMVETPSACVWYSDEVLWSGNITVTKTGELD